MRTSAPDFIVVLGKKCRAICNWQDGSARYEFHNDVTIYRSTRGKWSAFSHKTDVASRSGFLLPEGALSDLAVAIERKHSEKIERLEREHAKVMRAFGLGEDS